MDLRVLYIYILYINNASFFLSPLYGHHDFGLYQQSDQQLKPAVKTNCMVVSVFSGHVHTCTDDTILMKSILKFQ